MSFFAAGDYDREIRDAACTDDADGVRAPAAAERVEPRVRGVVDLGEVARAPQPLRDHRGPRPDARL
jgi:hypothetical protein